MSREMKVAEMPNMMTVNTIITTVVTVLSLW